MSHIHIPGSYVTMYHREPGATGVTVSHPDKNDNVISDIIMSLIARGCSIFSVNGQTDISRWYKPVEETKQKMSGKHCFAGQEGEYI